jgi:hypothetical protein
MAVGNGAAARVATSPAKPGHDQGKSAFLRELYKKNPNANVAAVNEAWKRAGKPGTISAPLMHLVRSQMGITKKRGAQPKVKAPVMAKPALSVRTSPGRGLLRAPLLRNEGKTAFVKELLQANPQASPKAVNDAWKGAGKKGTISESLVVKVVPLFGRVATVASDQAQSQPLQRRPWLNRRNLQPWCCMAVQGRMEIRWTSKPRSTGCSSRSSKRAE